MYVSKNALMMHDLSKLDMNILDFRYAALDAEWHNRDVLDLFTRIYCITSGSGHILTDNKALELVPGNIYIVPAGLNFSYYCTGALEKLFMHITVSNRDGYDIFYGCTDFIVIKNAWEITDTLSALFNSQNTAACAKTKSIVWDIINTGLKLTGMDTHKIKEYSPITEKCLKYINKHLKNTLSYEEIAAALFVSPSTLAAKFKQEIGFPLGKYINDRIMYEAEIKLKKTNMTIKEISEMFGFCDQFYFSRKFAAFYGLPPREYRKKNFI